MVVCCLRTLSEDLPISQRIQKIEGIFITVSFYRAMHVYCSRGNAISKKVKAVYSASWETHLTATGRHLPYGITQYYLPPDTSERAPPSYTPARQAGTRFTYPNGMEG